MYSLSCVCGGEFVCLEAETLRGGEEGIAKAVVVRVVDVFCQARVYCLVYCMALMMEMDEMSYL